MANRIRSRRNDSPETIARWRQDMQERQPWLRTTGPTSVAGKRRCSTNALANDLHSLAFAAACKYADAVARSLAWVDWQ